MNTTAETTCTMEALQMSTDRSYGAVMQYGNLVLVSTYRWTKGDGYGNDARVYRLTEQPIPGFGQDARGFIECQLELAAEATETFEDAGHAIAWAINTANTLEAK